MTTIEELRQKIANKEELTPGEYAVKMAMDIANCRIGKRREDFFKSAIQATIDMAEELELTQEDIETLKNAHLIQLRKEE